MSNLFSEITSFECETDVAFLKDEVQKCEFLSVFFDVLSATFPIWRLVHSSYFPVIAVSCLHTIQYGRKSALNHTIKMLSVNQCEILFEFGRIDIFFRETILQITAGLIAEIVLQDFALCSDENHFSIHEKRNLMNRLGIRDVEDKPHGIQVIQEQLDILAMYLNGISRRLQTNPTFFQPPDLAEFEQNLMEPYQSIIWKSKNVLGYYNPSFLKLLISTMKARRVVKYKLTEDTTKLLTGAAFFTISKSIPFDLANEFYQEYFHIISSDTASNVSRICSILQAEIVTQNFADLSNVTDNSNIKAWV